MLTHEKMARLDNIVGDGLGNHFELLSEMQTVITTAYVTGVWAIFSTGSEYGCGGVVHDKCYHECGTWLFVLIIVCDQLYDYLQAAGLSEACWGDTVTSLN